MPLRGYVFYPRLGSSWPFVDSSFSLFALRGYLLPPTQPLADPCRSSANPLVALRLSFVALRGYVFCLFAVLRGPSWIALFPFSPFVDIFFPLTRPLADPCRSSADPLVALRRSSWPFVDMFLPFRPSWISSSPYPTLGAPLWIFRRPLSGPSPFFVAPSWICFCLFVDFLSPLGDPRRIPVDPPPTP